MVFVVALAGFFVQTCVFGISNSLGVFVRMLTQDASLGSPSETTVGIASAVAQGLAQVLGAVCGRLADAIGTRPIIIMSIVFVGVACSAPALFAHSMTSFILLYSIPMALAIACMQSPIPVAIASYAAKKRSLAMGIAFAGGGAGSFVALVAGALADSTGSWRTSYQLLSCFCALGIVGAWFSANRKASSSQEALLPKPQTRDEQAPAQSKTAFYISLLTSRKCLILCAIQATLGYSFIGSMYVCVPFATSFGEAGTVYAKNQSIAKSTAASLLTAFGVLQIAGSVVLGVLADRLNNRVVFTLSSGVSAIVCMLWVFADSYITLVFIFAALGASLASSVGVATALIAEQYSENLGSVLGVVVLGFGVGAALSAPCLGALKGVGGEGSYTYSILSLGVCAIVSGVLSKWALPASGQAAQHEPKDVPV